MPKVHLTEDDRQRETFNHIISIQAAVTNNRTPCDKIAKIVGIPYSTYCYKVNKGLFDQKELKNLFDGLKFSNEQILQVFGREYKE